MLAMEDQAERITVLTRGLAVLLVGEMEMDGDADSVANLATFQTTLATFFFVVIKHFFFSHITHTASKIYKTKQQTHTQHLKVQSKGRERGKDNKNTKVTPLYNHVYQIKNTAKHHVEGLAPPTRAVATFT